MRGIAYLLTAILIILQPMTASAQFLTVEQDRQQAAMEQESELTDVLTQIAAKGDIASRQVQVLLAEAKNGRVGATATQRKIDTLLGKLKSDLNGIVNEFSKKNSSDPAAIRAVYTEAQNVLNTIRRQSAETLDQVGFDKAADPKALTGKYKDYQDEAKKIIEESLQKVDERLAEPGRRDTVRKDLEKMVDEAQRRLAIMTTSFITSNPDVLPSAIERVKKDQLDVLSKAMVDRFKSANSRSNDKVQDLTEDELRAIETAKAEMEGMVSRAIQTVDGIMQQVSSSNLPTSSQVAGVNPLLEAKYKAVKQTQEIRQSTADRLNKVRDRFMARTDMSQNAKDVFTNEFNVEKQRLFDTTKEFQSYFSAGDPKKKKYNERKEELQDEADGCGSFFCDLGRIVGGVGSAFINKATGGLVNIPGQAISGGLFGISDGNPSAFHGAYSYRYGDYGVYKASGGQIDPRCLSGVELPALVFIAKAQAQVVGGDTRTEENTQPNISKTTSSSKSGLDKFLSSASSLFKDPRYSAGLSGIIGGALTGNTANCASMPMGGGLGGYYGTPGFNPNYQTPFGGLPIGQMMGYGSNNLQLNGINLDNYALQLAQGLRAFMGTPGISASDQEIYRKVIGILESPGVSPTEKQNRAIAELRRTASFFKMAQGSSNGIANMFINLCAGVLSGNQNMIDVCKRYFREVPGATPPISSAGMPTSTSVALTDPADPSADIQVKIGYLARFERYQSIDKKDACSGTLRTKFNTILQQVNSMDTSLPGVFEARTLAGRINAACIALEQVPTQAAASAAETKEAKILRLQSLYKESLDEYSKVQAVCDTLKAKGSMRMTQTILQNIKRELSGIDPTSLNRGFFGFNTAGAGVINYYQVYIELSGNLEDLLAKVDQCIKKGPDAVTSIPSTEEDIQIAVGANITSLVVTRSSDQGWNLTIIDTTTGQVVKDSQLGSTRHTTTLKPGTYKFYYAPDNRTNKSIFASYQVTTTPGICTAAIPNPPTGAGCRVDKTLTEIQSF